MVRVHNGPLSISSNAQLVYHDLIARGRQIETARRWRSLIQRFEACCGVKDSYDRADVVKFVAELRKEGMKQNSINARLKALRLLCEIQNWDGGFPRLAMPKVISEVLILERRLHNQRKAKLQPFRSKHSEKSNLKLNNFASDLPFIPPLSQNVATPFHWWPVGIED